MTFENVLAQVERVLQRGRLNHVEELVFRHSWEGRSYNEIAKITGYNAGYLKDAGSKLWQTLSKICGEKVTKQNLQGVLRRSLDQTSETSEQPQSQLFQASVVPRAETTTSSKYQQDWGDAIDVSIFYGRSQELETLHQWIVEDRCRLVTLLGMGGMGKTSLSVKVAETVESQFDCLIWRSLRDAPPIDELLTELIQFVSQQEETQLPDSVGAKLSCLVKWLRRSRCLIILDNFETVLQGGRRARTYRDGYQMYGELLKRVGEIGHESCLLLTSREKPQEVGTLEGARLAVRALPLVGLDIASGQHILDDKGLYAAVDDLEELIAHCRGNPLALKMAAASIQDLFAGDVARFLQHGTVAFSNIDNLLQQQCNRLSGLEQNIINWLAVNREPATVTDLKTDLVAQCPTPELVEVLGSLRWRSLIESCISVMNVNNDQPAASSIRPRSHPAPARRRSAPT